MKYPIAIEMGGPKKTWGVVVPDLPGCFSAADFGIDEAIENAKEAIELWIEVALDQGMEIPRPSRINDPQKKKEYKGWIGQLQKSTPLCCQMRLSALTLLCLKECSAD